MMNLFQRRCHFKKLLMVFGICALSLTPLSQVPVEAVSHEELEDASSSYYYYAIKLSDLGIFLESDEGFKLDDPVTKIQGAVILVRMMGQEVGAAALEDEESEFTDVPDWANGYVNFVCDNGLMDPDSETEFGYEDTMTYQEFETLMLEALGYKSDEGDFSPSKAADNAVLFGLMDPIFYEEIEEEFLRNQAAKLIYDTLSSKMNGTDKTLIAYLYENEIFSADQFRAFNAKVANIYFGDSEEDESQDDELADSQTEETTSSTNSDQVDEDDDGEHVNVYESLTGEPKATKSQVKAWAKAKGMSKEGIALVDTYFELCEDKGLDPIIAYVQMCYETGFLYKNGTSGAGLDESYHNPCGLKTEDGGEDGDESAYISFDTWEDGIDAHTDHLALYAGVKGYPKDSDDTLDPRHFPGLFGIASNIKEMAASWASPTSNYASRIVDLYNEIIDTDN